MEKLDVNQLSFLQYSYEISEQVFDEKYPFPSTRYQGSKNKISDWIWENIGNLEFESALDAFGGTGCVSHMLKRKGKKVYYNDILKFNYYIGKALIENNDTFLSDSDVKFILADNGYDYPNFIQKNFENIFYTTQENIWLDRTITNIMKINNEYKKSIALFALFQACIIKRPYNLFHRANLYVRTNDVKRNFGNKVTWDKSFEEHFTKFVIEANQAIFDNNKVCKSMNSNALELIENDFDLVYMDTPYISNKGMSTDYLDFYHFLEGLCNYLEWGKLLNRNYKHLPIKGNQKSPWNNKQLIYQEFDKLFCKYKNSKLVVSYREDGIPTIDELHFLMKKYKNNVIDIYSKDYKYALSHNITKEVLLIGV